MGYVICSSTQIAVFLTFNDKFMNDKFLEWKIQLPFCIAMSFLSTLDAFVILNAY